VIYKQDHARLLQPIYYYARDSLYPRANGLSCCAINNITRLKQRALKRARF
jgi:NADH:ubiquinone oxidoreductase subunit B-like Fe-S oxidoreductase